MCTPGAGSAPLSDPNAPLFVHLAQSVSAQRNGGRSALSEAEARRKSPGFVSGGVPGQGKTLEVTGAVGTPLGDPTAWASDGKVTPTAGSRQQDSQWPGCQGEGGGTKRTSPATPAADGGGGEGRSR